MNHDSNSDSDESILSSNFGTSDFESGCPNEADQFLVLITKDSNVNDDTEESTEGDTQVTQPIRETAIYHKPPPELDAFIITKENMDTLNIGKCLAPDQQVQFGDLCLKWGHIFAHSLQELGRTNLNKCHIDLLPGTIPICSRKTPRWPPAVEEFARKRIAELLDAGMIEEYCGPWGAATVFPQKKSGAYRMCHAYCGLNSKTVPMHWPILHIKRCLDRLSGHKFYSLLGGFSGYYVVEMDDQSKDFTAFITPFGKYRYTVMPFGITNGPPTYALLNSRVFKDQLLGDGNVMEIFFDDNGLGSSSFSGHMELVAKAFKCYADAGMSLNPAKCLFFQKELHFWGMY